MSFGNFPKIFLNFSQADVNGENKNIFRFKSFRLDVGERQLLHHEKAVPLTPKAFDVLAYLVERNGHLVEKDELLEKVWADSFVEEINVARIVHTLRKALGEDENGNKFIETVAKKGYRFVAKVTEVHFGDAETVVEKLPRPKVVSPSPRLSVSPSPRLILFAVGFLSAVFLIVLLSFNFRSDSVTNPNKAKSITVLPVKPINAANRDEIYEFGIADSLIHRLSASKNFIVRPLSATRKYADLEQDPVAAGREQKTDYVLAANYQIADGRIRVTAQLFNVASGQIEETKIIEKDTGSVFAVQDAVAGEVGNFLLARFAATESPPLAKRGTTNEEAYRLYLQGRNLTMQQNARDHKKAIEHFEQAIRLDPNYALAYARMANAYLWLDVLDNVVPRVEKITEIINKALELDPNLAEAYVARGHLNLVFEWNLPAAEKDLLRAIELEPNHDTAHWLYALLLASRKQFDEALISIEKAQAIDPSATQYMFHRGRILYYARRYDESVVQFERLTDLEPNAFSNWMQFAYQMKGDEAKAYEIFMKIQKRRKSDYLEIYQKTYETTGWQGVRRKMIEFAKLDENELGGGAFNVAKECAWLGEKDQAFEFLNKAVEKRRWLMYTLNVEPAFDSLRDDARFDELLKRVGLK
jgi:DNA-binding winged helix-turn-helix (wHTH) protein/tetratricopeptide (TPR) repeat protein